MSQKQSDGSLRGVPAGLRVANPKHSWGLSGLCWWRLHVVAALGCRLTVKHKMDHLVCFVPGMLALGVQTKAVEGEKAQRYMEVAANVTHTCWMMYRSQPTGGRVGSRGWMHLDVVGDVPLAGHGAIGWVVGSTPATARQEQHSSKQFRFGSCRAHPSQPPALPLTDMSSPSSSCPPGPHPPTRPQPGVCDIHPGQRHALRRGLQPTAARNDRGLLVRLRGLAL